VNEFDKPEYCHGVQMSVTKPVLIIGAGIAGMAAAHVIAHFGLDCVLVEQAQNIGGNVNNWACMATNQCRGCFACTLSDLKSEMETSNIRIITGAAPKSIQTISKFQQITIIEDKRTKETSKIESSAVIIATGMLPFDPSSRPLLGYRSVHGVFSTLEINRMLMDDDISALVSSDSTEIAFFQCVGSRDKSNNANYCSQFCCKAALRMALKLSDLIPNARITIYYIDLQLADYYGGKLLEDARNRGIRLLQGVPGEVIERDHKLQVCVEASGLNTVHEYDRIILSIGQRPRQVSFSINGNEIKRDFFGYFSPEINSDNAYNGLGVYFAGACTAPKGIEQSISHGEEIAARALTNLGSI
jgi:heterodisulfide reductase subunit A2